MARDKVRIRFRKAGDLRLLSHHDLMRSFERILRRSSLPFRSTEGFHPTPRMVFALALPLGVAGLNEVVELELTEEIQPEDVLDRLRRHAPPGFDFLSAARIATSVTARPRKALYSLAVPPGESEAVAARVAAFLDADACWIERHHPNPRLINIRPFVDSARVDGSELAVAMWVSQEGSARCEEVVRALGLESLLLDGGAALVRCDLLLLDEMDPAEAARAPALSLRDSRPIPNAPALAAGRELEKETAAAAHWGASPHGPAVE